MEESLFHTIKVSLHDNFLTDNPNDLSAKVASERTLTSRDICKSAINRAKLPSTVEAMEHNVGLFFKEMSYQLCDGFAVNTGYFTANAQVRGVWESATEPFNPEKHSILFRFNQGSLLRKLIPEIKVQVLGIGDSSILISHVTDRKSGSVNDLITPHGTLKIKGGKLKIAGDNPAIGVFFQDEFNNMIKVQDNDIIVNNPAELIVEIPTLAPGAYKLVISNQFGGNSKTFLKTPRTLIYDKILTVV